MDVFDSIDESFIFLTIPIDTGHTLEFTQTPHIQLLHTHTHTRNNTFFSVGLSRRTTKGRMTWALPLGRTALRQRRSDEGRRLYPQLRPARRFAITSYLRAYLHTYCTTRIDDEKKHDDDSKTNTLIIFSPPPRHRVRRVFFHVILSVFEIIFVRKE